MSTKRYTGAEKMKILREYLEGGTPISDLADKYDLHPNAIYVWKKNLFENGAELFVRKSKRNTKDRQETDSKSKKRIAELENTLRVRENLISELATDLITLKKKENGAI